MKKTQLVGILNCTPDSYFEKGRIMEPQAAIEYGLRLYEEGADILDIGGESTRPNFSIKVSAQEEIKRIIPVIEGIRKKTDRPISVDTFKPTVAQAALAAGVTIINDITGFTNPQMRNLAAKSDATCIVMHMKGTPHSIPDPDYPQGVITEIIAFFKNQVNQLVGDGVNPSKIILDPGIGGGSFGKTPEQSLQIVKYLKIFHTLGYPLLIALSRKSFLQKILSKEASEVLSTTIALNTICALEGAAYIRVHDIGEHRDVLTLLDYMEVID